MSDKRVDFELMLLLGGVWSQGMSLVTSLSSSGVDVHTAQPENVRTSQLQVGETYLLSTQLACLTGFFFYDYFLFCLQLGNTVAC